MHSCVPTIARSTERILKCLFGIRLRIAKRKYRPTLLLQTAQFLKLPCIYQKFESKSTLTLPFKAFFLLKTFFSTRDYIFLLLLKAKFLLSNRTPNYVERQPEASPSCAPATCLHRILHPQQHF